MTDGQTIEATLHRVLVADIPPAPPPHPIQWRRALRALRELLDSPNQTEKAFEIFVALGDDTDERGFARFRAHPQGGRLLAQRPSLIHLLADRAALARMPEESFGRAYLAYLERTGLDPAGLLTLKTALQERLQAAGESFPALDPAREWFRDRTILLHDLWHVLTGYGTDELGEAALLPFSYAQGGGRANALLVIGVAARGTRALGLGFLRYLYQAWRRGRRAAWLVALPYEELLPQPLDDVRRGAGIEPTPVAHAGGIRRGSLMPAVDRCTD
jgi:ubiquinone biosynthesis protein COQ4